MKSIKENSANIHDKIETEGYGTTTPKNYTCEDYPFIDSTGGDVLYEAPIIDGSLMDIIKDAMNQLQLIEDIKVRGTILMLFGKLAIKLKSSELIKKTHFLPPIRLFDMEDNSILIEWMFNDFRIGFSVEENTDKSSYYIVSNKPFENLGEAGYLYEVNINTLLEDFISYIEKNT